MNQPETFYAYHAVTERPMAVGQVICFDETHHSGVWQRVMEKAALVQDIYAHPQQYDSNRLEHQTAVALRELALEEVRKTVVCVCDKATAGYFQLNDAEYRAA